MTVPQYLMRTQGGIPYEEVEGSPTFSATAQGMAATQIYRMPWDYALRFLMESFPQPARQGCKWDIPVTRLMPGMSWLKTTKVDIVPFNPERMASGGAFASYPNGARVTINYETTNQSQDDIVTHRVGVGGEFLVLNKGAWRWKTTETIKVRENGQEKKRTTDEITDDGVRLAKIIPTIEHTLTYHTVPNPPWDTIVAAIGCVNTASCKLFGAAEETLLFTGAEAESGMTVTGMRTWRIDYKFAQRVVKSDHKDQKPTVSGKASSPAIGWNHFYRHESRKWDKIVCYPTDADGKEIKGGTPYTLYPAVDLSQIFAPSGCR